MLPIYIYIILFPLLGFLINALLGNKLSKTISGAIASVAILIPFLISCSYFFGFNSGNAQAINVNLFEWISFGQIHISFGLLIDQLSCLWLLFITGIGFLIHVYSIGYMHDDEGFQRFFSYLNLFIFFMLLLVLGNNLLVMFIGWEGVGLCSYLLIGFWFKNQDYNDAAKKAFVMNRIGDLGFLIGMFLLLYYGKSLAYADLVQSVTSIDHPIIVLATLALFIGACGKSAQIPLYTWLPDAMAGPTPVSALIHAATMVTAGIFMICRMNFLFILSPETMQVITIVGVSTALFAATIGVLQNDIKKVLAYSTVSQLGLMFMALGLGAFVSGAFHVVTHAFFKACLFLGSGSVIHALHGEQDMRKMGGLKKWMPITFITFLIATLAIAGVPPFAGFFSKDEILEKAFEHHKIVWVLASLASILTAFYMFRIVYLTFFKSFRGTDEQEKHLHESPWTITFPLIVLAVLSLVGGFMGIPEIFKQDSHWLAHYLSPVLKNVSPEVSAHSSHTSETLPMILAVIGAVIGICFAWFKYISQSAVPVADGRLKGFASLVYQKYKIDELYNFLIVKPMLFLSEMTHDVIDRKIVDGIVNSTATSVMQIGKQARWLQSGHIGFYLLAMVLGIVIIFGYVFLR